MIVVYRTDGNIITEKTNRSVMFNGNLVYIGDHVINISELILIAEG